MDNGTKAALAFSGTLKKVELAAPKMKASNSAYSDSAHLSGGALVITIEVPRPELMPEPAVPWQLRQYIPFGGTEAPPEDPGPEPEGNEDDEDDEAYATWSSAAYAFEDFNRLSERYGSALAEYERSSGDIGTQFRAWMQLAGVGAVLQGLPLTLTLTPDQEAVERYLPGFSPALALAAPQQDATS